MTDALHELGKDLASFGDSFPLELPYTECPLGHVEVGVELTPIQAGWPQSPPRFVALGERRRGHAQRHHLVERTGAAIGVYVRQADLVVADTADVLTDVIRVLGTAEIGCTDPLPSLHHMDPQSGLRQPQGRGGATETGPDNEGIGVDYFPRTATSRSGSFAHVRTLRRSW